MASGSVPAMVSKQKLRLSAGAGAVILMVFAISLVSLSDRRTRTLRSSEQYLDSYSNVVAEQAEAAFRSVDVVLSSVADYLARTGVNDSVALANLPKAGATNRELRDRLTGMPQVTGFILVDKGGRVVATSYDALPDGVNLADRDYFRALRDDPSSEAFISEPLKSRISGARVILLARRLSEPDGGFMGLVVGALSQRYFEDYYAATSAGEQTSVVLSRADGARLAAFPASSRETAATWARDVELRLHSLQSSIPPSGEDRLEATRRVANLPISVSVSQAYDQVLREWRKTAVLTGLMSACIAALVAAFSFIVARSWRTQATFLAKLENSETLAHLRSQQFETTLANLPQGLCMYDRSERIVVVNDQFARLYDLEPKDVPPGATFQMVIERRIARGSFPGSDPDAYRRGETLPKLGAEPVLHRLPNGRVLSVSRHAMPNGGWVSQHMDVTEEHKALERVHYLAHHDSLTQLFNRAQLLERMNQALDMNRRRLGGGFCVHLLDLDMFKAVNDTLGHGVGDKLLQQVSARLVEATRGEDIVARLGGDEFAVMQPVDDTRWRESAESLADHLLRRITEPYVIDGHDVVIGTSIGIAHAPDDGLEVDELMSKADMALYKAKAAGRKALRFYDSSLETEARRRHNLQLDLHAAIVDEQFELHYQPIVAASTGDIVCVEALARWRHPRDGLIEPDCFIPVAEESGAIVGLGEWVLRRACLDALRWPESIRVAVNISPVQLKTGDLAATVARVLAETGMAADRLELEITENVFMQNQQESLLIINRLKQLGVTISLDDFGAGYSSLAYIRAFPLDKLKIDKSFVAEASQRRDCAAIVSAVVFLARSLNIATVAEGVETQAHRVFARAAGCTYLQGYYFGRPVAADVFLASLEKASA